MGISLTGSSIRDFLIFLVTQKLHVQGLSCNRRQLKKKDHFLLVLKPLKPLGLFSQRGDSISVPSMFHKVSIQFQAHNPLIVSPVSVCAWGKGQHDSVANATLMRGRETVFHQNCQGKLFPVWIGVVIARGHLQLFPEQIKSEY